MNLVVVRCLRRLDDFQFEICRCRRFDDFQFKSTQFTFPCNLTLEISFGVYAIIKATCNSLFKILFFTIDRTQQYHRFILLCILMAFRVRPEIFDTYFDD